jgi:membrane fusion protein, heavy metal efflux system
MIETKSRKAALRLAAWTLCCTLTACGSGGPPPGSNTAAGAAAADEQEQGPNGGRLLRDGDFTVELAIFETGVPPEYRAWVTERGVPVEPAAVQLHVTLTRLGSADEIAFRPRGDHLLGDQVIHEPHSFSVSVEALYGGRVHRWNYDSFEGRTRIGADVAEAFGLETSLAGPAVIEETATLYGRIVPNRERVRSISARFDGAIRSVAVSLGDVVAEGDTLATVESNESLQTYEITAPIAGVVTERSANSGEQTDGRRLFTLTDTSSVWAELAVFPSDRPRVHSGAKVRIETVGDGDIDGEISRIDVMAGPNQAVSARVVLDNADGRLLPGTYVVADVTVAEHEVPLAVRRSALQTFRDFTVVYAQYGDEYEVRMLELGRQNAEWAEVLGGLEPGTRYVTENSYVLKADVEKSGAVHDH